MDETLERATALIQRYLDAEGVSLFLLNEEGDELVCRACTSDPDITGMRLAADRGVVGRCLREKRVQLVRDTAADPDFFPDIDRASGSFTECLMCAPLQADGKLFGALEAINKHGRNASFSAEDRDLLALLADAAALAINHARTMQLRIGDERTRRELELASEIQRAFLPAETDRQPRAAALNTPARTVSGDFYDLHCLADGRTYFCLGDVAGKGMNAALLMAKISALFRLLVKQAREPAALLADLNTELFDSVTHGMFATMVAGVLDFERGIVTLANAGHQPPLYLHSDGWYEIVEKVSPPLGVLPELNPESSQLELKGGSLFLFTDGLTECWQAPGQALEVEGVRDLLLRHAEREPLARLRAVAQEATAWKRESSGYLHDDITIMVLQGAGKSAD